MTAVEQLEIVLAKLRDRDYVIRHEWLAGSGGGACELRGRRILFVDVAQSHFEQLELASGILNEVLAGEATVTRADENRAA